MTALTVNPDRRIVRVDLDTLSVYPLNGRGARTRIGSVTHYVENEGARTPSGGRFVSLFAELQGVCNGCLSAPGGYH